jgi:hypothetical protein
MTSEQQFIDQFEDEIFELEPSIEQSILSTLFYITILPRLRPYLNNGSVVFIGATGPSIYIVLQRDNNLDIHFEIFPDRTAVYSVFVCEDMQESNEGSIEEVLNYVVDVLNPVVPKFTGTQEDIQKAIAWARENLKI